MNEWQYDSTTSQWWKKVTSGFITLYFAIVKSPNGEFYLKCSGECDRQYLNTCDVSLAKQSADQHIKHALRWV